jgi:hypothetical protein
MLHDAWLAFDRLTAFGCAARGIKFDLVACDLAWYSYMLVYKKLGIVPPQPPIGYQGPKY